MYMHSLVYGKARVLRKVAEEDNGSPPGIKETDAFVLNEQFVSVYKRMQLTAPIIKQEAVAKSELCLMGRSGESG